VFTPPIVDLTASPHHPLSTTAKD